MSTLLDSLKNHTVPRLRDYIGFTFNDVHSSQFNILRVSDGSRYSTDLLPSIEDYSIDIVGGYGANYFGGTFKKREFTLNIAYDNVDEMHFRAMREWLSDRETHDLFFDECPYKVYNAVISKTPTFKFIAFGSTGTRVYKGEGTIVFTCYDPIGYSKNGNYLKDIQYENVAEWADASNMLYDTNKIENGSTIANYYDTPKITATNTTIKIYNAGILPTPCQLFLSWTGTTLSISLDGSEKIKLNRTNSTNSKEQGNLTVLIDTERSLAIVINNFTETTINNKTIYNWNEYTNSTTSDGRSTKEYTILNQLIETGRFFTLPLGEHEIMITGATLIGPGIKYYHRYL